MQGLLLSSPLLRSQPACLCLPICTAPHHETMKTTACNVHVAERYMLCCHVLCLETASYSCRCLHHAIEAYVAIISGEKAKRFALSTDSLSSSKYCSAAAVTWFVHGCGGTISCQLHSHRVIANNMLPYITDPFAHQCRQAHICDPTHKCSCLTSSSCSSACTHILWPLSQEGDVARAWSNPTWMSCPIAADRSVLLA